MMTVITDFLHLRRHCRALSAYYDAAAWKRRVFLRALKKKRTDIPALLNARLRKQFQRQVENCDKYCAYISEQMCAAGRYFIHIESAIDRCTTFEQRCDLINVNRSDRARLNQNAGIKELIFIEAMEDSATHQLDAYNNGPVFNAVKKFLLSNPEMDSNPITLFDPGKPFYGIPYHRRQTDGSWSRVAPALTVHDATGSHIVRRDGR